MTAVTNDERTVYAKLEALKEIRYAKIIFASLFYCISVC